MRRQGRCADGRSHRGPLARTERYSVLERIRSPAPAPRRSLASLGEPRGRVATGRLRARARSPAATAPAVTRRAPAIRTRSPGTAPRRARFRPGARTRSPASTPRGGSTTAWVTPSGTSRGDPAGRGAGASSSPSTRCSKLAAATSRRDAQRTRPIRLTAAARWRRHVEAVGEVVVVPVEDQRLVRGRRAGPARRREQCRVGEGVAQERRAGPAGREVGRLPAGQGARLGWRRQPVLGGAESQGKGRVIVIASKPVRGQGPRPSPPSTPHGAGPSPVRPALPCAARRPRSAAGPAPPEPGPRFRGRVPSSPPKWSLPWTQSESSL